MEINKLLLRKFFARNKMDDGRFYNYNEIPLYKLGKFIERDKKDIGFWLNQLKPGITGSHKKENFAIPAVSWIDIDFHTNQQKTDFLKDVKDPKQFMKDLSNDEGVFICGRTLGGGIRIIGLIESYYLEYEEWCNEGNYDDEQYLDKQDKIFQLNNIIFANYLSKYGIKMGRSYFDVCSDKISQPTYPIKPGTMHINLQCASHKHFVSIDALSYYTGKDNSGEHVKISDEKLLKISMDNSEMVIDLYNNQPKNISNLFKTYSPRLSAIMKFSDGPARQAWYYMMEKYYTGKSFRPFLKSFDTFEKWLDNEKSLEYAPDLYWELKKYKII